MFDFSDIFSGDTWDAISNGIGKVAPAANTVGSLIGGISGMQNQRNLRNDYANTVSNLNQLYSPNSPYAQQMRQQLERRDAATGRRSQYGPREAELAAKLTQLQSGQLMNPQYAALLRGQNMGTMAPMMGALGYLTKNQNQTNPAMTAVNSASKLNNLRKGYNYLSDLFGPDGADAAAAQLGDAGAAATNFFGGGNAATSMSSPMYDMMGTNAIPYNFGDVGAKEGGIFGQAFPDLSLGGAGEFGGAAGALSGMGGGSLAGTVGGADTLGSLFGGTGFLPGYTSTAGSSLFGSGAGAAGAAGAEGAGAGGFGGAGFGGLAGLTALPFGLAIGGMLSGAFGGGDNGTPYTQAQDAYANYLTRNPSGQDFSRGVPSLEQYMQQNNLGDYQSAASNLQGAGGGGAFLSNLFGSEQGMGG